MNTHQELLQVAVQAPLPEPLTYRSAETVEPGTLVEVPLGKRKALGVALGRPPQSAREPNSKFEIKSVGEIRSDIPRLSPVYLQWAQWVARYYCYPLGEVLRLAFPSLPRSKKIDTEEISTPVIRNTSLTLEQSAVLANIPVDDQFRVHLVHGVTGSGKTEIYMRLLSQCLQSKKPGLLLVPEISLTPQLVQRFSERFPGQVAVIHSGLTPRARTNAWWDVVTGKKPILIGARSALFCPVERWGLIVVDEEHEPSFKQEEKLKYHARDAAIRLAQMSQSPIVLGSATPSVETYQKALTGKYRLHELKERVEARSLPTLQVIDMKLEKESPSIAGLTKKDLPNWMSGTLYRELQANLERGEQSALFLNRRGLSSQVLCRACGFIEECPNCAISLTLHGRHSLVCHYCQYEKKMDLDCPSCKSAELVPVGLGTEQVEADVSHLFPTARVARADRDEIKSRSDLEEMIQKMESGRTQILIGTQMIAKGLDFKGLTLVGLVLADVGFYLPDFRASERSFQLITQVAGRSGRHSREAGRVIVQTYNPMHPSIQFALRHDYVGFAQEELRLREQFDYPPASRLCLIRIQGREEASVEKAAHEVSEVARKLAQKTPTAVDVLGPGPAPLSRIRGLFRYHTLLKHSDPRYMIGFHEQLLQAFSALKSQKTGARLQLVLDVEPLSML